MSQLIEGVKKHIQMYKMPSKVSSQETTLQHLMDELDGFKKDFEPQPPYTFNTEIVEEEKRTTFYKPLEPRIISSACRIFPKNLMSNKAKQNPKENSQMRKQEENKVPHEQNNDACERLNSKNERKSERRSDEVGQFNEFNPCNGLQENKNAMRPLLQSSYKKSSRCTLKKLMSNKKSPTSNTHFGNNRADFEYNDHIVSWHEDKLKNKKVRSQDDYSKELSESLRELNSQLMKKFRYQGDYIVIEKINHGRFGEVSRIFVKQFRQFLALKKLLPNEDENLNRKNAEREFRALLKISENYYPELLRVFKLEIEPEFSVQMEYGQGTLRNFMNYMKKNDRKWSDQDLLELFYQLVNQIDRLKKIKMCHRDIKPDNIIISDDGNMKLSDYGLAKILQKDGIQEMSVAGTPGYLHPTIKEAKEQGLIKCSVDPYEADMFSIKATINEIMQLDCRMDDIDHLINKYKNYTLKNRIEVYEAVKEKYKAHIFEELYKRLSPEEKYEKLHTLIDYCNYEETTNWLKTKLNNHANQANQEEFRICLLLAGELFHEKCKYKIALQFYKICERTGEMNNKTKALLYNLQGRALNLSYSFTYAEVYHFKSLEIKIKEYGEQSSEVAEEYYYLGVVKRFKGEKEKALEFLEKARWIYETNNSKKGEIILNKVYNEIGIVKEQLGQYSDALKIHKKRFEKCKKIRGKVHPDVASSLNNMGLVYEQLGNSKKSLKCFFNALKTRIKICGEEHYYNSHFFVNIGSSYSYLNQKGKAIHYLKKGVELICKDPNRNPYIFAWMCTIIEIYLVTKKYRQAEEYLLLCIEAYEQSSPDNLIDLFLAWNNWNHYSKKKRQLKLADENFNKRNEGFKRASKKHPAVPLLNQQLALVYAIQGRYQEALSILIAAYKVMKESTLEILSDLSLGFFMIGEVYFAMKKYKTAQIWFLKSLDTVKRMSLRPDYPIQEEIESYLTKIKRNHNNNCILKYSRYMARSHYMGLSIYRKKSNSHKASANREHADFKIHIFI